MNRYLPLLGRVLIGAPFILSDLSKLATHDAIVGYISSVGLAFPQLAWLIAMVVEMGGDALLIIGYRARHKIRVGLNTSRRGPLQWSKNLGELPN